MSVVACNQLHIKLKIGSQRYSNVFFGVLKVERVSRTNLKDNLD